MYSKPFAQRNNMRKHIVISDSRRRSLVLRPATLTQEVLCRANQRTRLLLQARMSHGSFLRMSCVKSSNRNMLCDLCNEKAVTRCPYCKTAQYCGAEHRKSDFKLHKKKCMGLPSVEKEQQFRENRLNGYTPMDLLQNRFFERAEFVVDTLRKQGYCYLDDFHGEDIALKILSEVKNLHHREKFTDGELVSSNGNGSMLNKKIRDDKIAWIDGKEENCQAISHHMTTVNTLIRFCNGLIEEYDIEHRTKQAMVACYPGQGTCYKRHVDNPNKDGRCITTLYYLNPGWTEEKGGMLNLYPGGSEEPVKILPRLDRLLLFWSDRRNPHEVAPSHDVRYAITLWYFDKNERARFRKKQEEEERKKAIFSGQVQYLSHALTNGHFKFLKY
ncbi:egl nine homolog 1-like isoform X1 [Pocillopora damicornis]|uniref:egl nine homolog 1-like isoform X1 n=2 Tax=Pocillopora damicornis TaxID=46731 RepID=UPI000F556818|nr:egl nine homolog 1-like isoform X1 [Pocillopora damicornis]